MSDRMRNKHKNSASVRQQQAAEGVALTGPAASGVRAVESADAACSAAPAGGGENLIMLPKILERRQLKHFFLALLLLSALLLLLVWLNIVLGSVNASFGELRQALLHPRAELAADSRIGLLRDILWKIRLPRLCGVLLLGGALSLSGFLLQTFFHNPIAGPYILGISSGAKLIVALILVFLLSAGNIRISSFDMVLAAFSGSMICLFFVLLISRVVHSASVLVVSGVMIGYICSAITDFVITFADDASVVNLHNWSRGSFSGLSWDHIKVMAGPVLLCSLFVFLLSKPLAAYRLGENYARSVGVNLRFLRLSLVFLSSMLSACVTAFAGPISFVGIAVPHIVKALIKSSRPLFVAPLCFLCGSVFCLACDLIARTAFAPLELSVSSVTAVFGAPIVIAVLLRRSKGRE